MAADAGERAGQMAVSSKAFFFNGPTNNTNSQAAAPRARSMLLPKVVRDASSIVTFLQSIESI